MPKFLLADMALDEFGSRRVRELVAQQLIVADKFYFNASAMRYVGELVKDQHTSELLLENAQFAVPPHPVTFIEVDRDAYLLATQPESTLKPDRDAKFGFLVVKNTVYTLSARQDSTHAGLLPFIIDLNHPQQQLITEMYATTFHLAMRCHVIHCLGSSAQPYFERTMGPWEEIKEKSFEDLSRIYQYCVQHNIRVMQNTLEPGVHRSGVYMTRGEKVRRLAPEFAGDLRLIIALLLVMHRASKTIFMTEGGGEKGWIGRKQKRYMKHNVVNFNLNPHETIKRAFENTEPESRRRHSVRQHYAHWNKTKWHEHPNLANDTAFQQLDETHWLCERCGCLRVLRKSFMRGDASKGYVTKDYNVYSDDPDKG
jgi:hypothetical protein